MSILNKRSSEAQIVADWKIKFKSMSLRETSQQHFAKQGIRWHGILCLCFTYEELEVDDVMEREVSWAVQYNTQYIATRF